MLLHKGCKQNYQEILQLLPKMHLKLDYITLFPGTFLAMKWGAQEDARDCVQWRRDLDSNPTEYAYNNCSSYSAIPSCTLTEILYSFYIGIFEGKRQIHRSPSLCMFLQPDSMTWAALINLDAWAPWPTGPCTITTGSGSSF